MLGRWTGVVRADNTSATFEKATSLYVLHETGQLGFQQHRNSPHDLQTPKLIARINTEGNTNLEELVPDFDSH
jgi:hypothetical protein